MWSRRLVRRGGAAALALGLALAAGCGDSPGQSAAAAPAADGPRRGGTLVAGVIADMGSPNVYAVLSERVTQEVVTLMFLRLVEEEPDYQDHPPTIKPLLAKSWEFSPDRKSLTFHLRTDVTWSDGVPVTADDVRFSWQAQTDPAVLWDSAYYKADISDVEALDPHTVRFHFKRVSAQALLDVNEGEIVPEHVWSQLPFDQWRQHSDWFVDHLVVDGPYVLESWTPQQEIVLRRNERYYEPGKPYIDRVVLREVADRSSLLTQALAGKLDHVLGLTTADMKRVESSPRLVPLSFWGRGMVFVAWNLRNPLFAETEVRQALTMAIDREAIVEAVYGPYGRVGVSPILSDVWAFNHDLEPWPYDPERARQLLAAHGWRDSDGDGILDKGGKRFSFSLETNAGNQQRQDAVVMIQEQLRRVGIDVHVRTMAFGPLMDRANRHNFEAILMKWGMPTDLGLSFAFHTRSIDEASNVFCYSNPEADRLMDAAESVTDLADRRRYLDPLQEILHRDQPMTLLWESKDLGAVSKRLHLGGQPPNVIRAFWHLWDWWLEPD
jgi:peptide/nickel transport system substrate-binding protein